jgi:hypothetical protein
MKVIFRKFKKGDDVIAFMPGIKEVNRGMMLSYQHIGQHGEADYHGCLKITVLASQIEYMPLLKELASIYEERIVPIAKYNRQ